MLRLAAVCICASIALTVWTSSRPHVPDQKIEAVWSELVTLERELRQAFIEASGDDIPDTLLHHRGS